MTLSPASISGVCSSCGQALLVACACSCSVAAPSPLADVSSEALLGELMRRGTLVLSTNVPVGLALEDVERARKALPLADPPDAREGELADLDVASLGLVEGWCDQFSHPSWTARLYRAFVGAVWARRPEHRRQALVELAALAVRWVEALDAREPDGLEGGAR